MVTQELTRFQKMCHTDDSVVYVYDFLSLGETPTEIEENVKYALNLGKSVHIITLGRLGARIGDSSPISYK